MGLGLPQTAKPAGKLYIGEAAGFQDVFAGFGIRMATSPGYVAAQSILTGQDYDQLWRARYGSLMKAAAVNRWLQEAASNRGYDALLWPVAKRAFPSE